MVDLSPAAVRALTHPLRSRLLTTLREQGGATATELARDLGTNTGATSYHLRQLEKAGLVIDTGDGDGKRRLWAPAPPPDDHPVGGEDEDTAAAMDWLERDWLRHFTDKFGRWLEVRGAWPGRWRRSTGMNDYLVVVSAEQLDALHAEIEDVLDRYRRVGQGNPDAKRVATYVSFYPVDMNQPPRR